MKVIVILLLHLVVIVSGTAWYLRLASKMRATIDNPPELQLFLTFGIYGGLLLMVVHSLICQWSGMASLGMFALLFAAPIIAIGIAYSLRKFKDQSIYHYRIYLSGILYTPVVSLVFLGLVYFVTYLEESKF